jgi:hypothetical protein
MSSNYTELAEAAGDRTFLGFTTSTRVVQLVFWNLKFAIAIACLSMPSEFLLIGCGLVLVIEFRERSSIASAAAMYIYH